jgi:5-methylthioadenosine/S-adenosylhomocysteine deaminase
MERILIHGGTVITMNAARQIIRTGDLLVEGDKIVDIEPAGQLQPNRAHRVIDASDQLVLPGLINCHTHAVDYLMRGLGMDRTVLDWLQDLIWPCLREVTEEDAYYGAMLGYVECLKSGVTSLVDNCNMPAQRASNIDAIAQAAVDAQVRVVVARGYSDTPFVCPPDFLETVDQVVKEYERIISTWHRADSDRVRIWVTPVNLSHCSGESIKAVANVAQEHGLGIHTHVAESKDEREAVVDRFHKGYLETFHDLGVLGPLFHSVHSVWISEEEIDLLAETDASVVYNPTSNMLLASGIAPVARLLSSGVNVALGTDNPNNSNDMLEAMKYAGLLQKVGNLDPLAVPAPAALTMATVAGARALGMNNKIGSLEVGKQADITIVDMRRFHNTPVHDPIANLVYSANGSDVTTVMVGGKVLVEEGKVNFLDEGELMDKVQRRATDLVKRADANTRGTR